MVLCRIIYCNFIIPDYFMYYFFWPTGGMLIIKKQTKQIRQFGLAAHCYFIFNLMAAVGYTSKILFVVFTW